MGRRWGKSFMAGTLAVTVADHGGAVAWVVPVYKNARPVWRFVETLLAPVRTVKLNKTERTVEFPSGGWLGVYSADNDVALRGEAFDLAIVDEAAQVAETTYTDVLLPTLADRNGRIILISTPKGKNWLWQEWVKAQQDTSGQSAAFTAPSAANPLPSIRHAFELARGRVSDRTFRQEWLAEFIDDGGGVFRRIREAATAQVQDCAIGNHEYVIGVDWGRTNDATVFAVFDLQARELCYLDRMTQTDYGLQVDRLKALVRRFGRASVVAELNSMGGPLVERLQQEGLAIQGFQTTNASKAQIIDGLALGFERNELRIIPNETLITELQAYESQRLPGGLVRFAAPAGMHDDCVMALALAHSPTLTAMDAASIASAFAWQQ